MLSPQHRAKHVWTEVGKDGYLIMHIPQPGAEGAGPVLYCGQPLDGVTKTIYVGAEWDLSPEAEEDWCPVCYKEALAEQQVWREAMPWFRYEGERDGLFKVIWVAPNTTPPTGARL